MNEYDYEHTDHHSDAIASTEGVMAGHQYISLCLSAGVSVLWLGA